MGIQGPSKYKPTARPQICTDFYPILQIQLLKNWKIANGKNKKKKKKRVILEDSHSGSMW